MADVNYCLEFVLSDHPVAEQVRLWWRLCDGYGQEDARLYWLALQDRDGEPLLEAAAAAWAIRDRLEVTCARVTLEEVVRFAVDPRYRYPARYLGQAALAQEALLDVDPDRPYPSPEADLAERQVGDMLASADQALAPPAHMYRAVFFHWKAAARADDAQWYELPARAELILVPADCHHSLLRARQQLSHHLRRVEALASELAPPEGRTGASEPGGPVGEPVHRAAALVDLDWHTAVADALEAAIADTLLWFRQQELGVHGQRTDLDTLLRLAHTNPTMTSSLAGIWGELHRSERAADLRVQGHPMLWRLARQAAASLADCPPDLTGELEQADTAYTALVRHSQDLRAAILTADDRPLWRRWLTSRAHTREQAARHADLTTIETRIQDAEGRLRELLSAQQQRADWLAERSAVLAVGLLAAAELRDRRGVILQQLALAPPDYLTAELGACPAGGTAAREQWLRGALLIEHYRVDHTITDTARALGARPADQVGRTQHDRAAQHLRTLRATLDRHRDPPSRIHPAGPDLPPAGFD